VPLAALARDDDADARHSNVTPAYEDAHLRIFAIDHDGERSLYRMQTKATGRNVSALARDGVRDRNGKARVLTEEFGTEFEARQQMRRRAALR
jgi:hypothetical protein